MIRSMTRLIYTAHRGLLRKAECDRCEEPLLCHRPRRCHPVPPSGARPAAALLLPASPIPLGVRVHRLRLRILATTLYSYMTSQSREMPGCFHNVYSMLCFRSQHQHLTVES